MPELAYADYLRAIRTPSEKRDLADRIIIRIFQGAAA